ncbi:MAG TPA: carboxypeptidase-like regulatory domain-containing protein, partial [Draconibacterium sp.]|nr:carboxypeptidase-like regulatory domain-containing protein [Draconibacterium sp.]
MQNNSKTENKFVLILMLLVTSIMSAFADENITISGYVRSAETGEGLIGSTIYVAELKTGTISNAYGFYSLTLPKGSYTIQFSYIGYEQNLSPVSLVNDIVKDVELLAASTEVEEIVVRSEAEDKNIRKAEMGVTKLSPKQTRMIPVILGEQDILKTIQLLPGVSSGTEGTTGFYVRGGGVDQNLIILDEAPVYSASHLMGFFSVFNSDAIKDIELYKGNA